MTAWTTAGLAAGGFGGRIAPLEDVLAMFPPLDGAAPAPAGEREKAARVAASLLQALEIMAGPVAGNA